MYLSIYLSTLARRQDFRWGGWVRGGIRIGTRIQKYKLLFLINFAYIFPEKTVSHLSRYVKSVNFRWVKRHREHFCLFKSNFEAVERERKRTDEITESKEHSQINVCLPRWLHANQCDNLLQFAPWPAEEHEAKTIEHTTRNGTHFCKLRHVKYI